MPFYRVTLDDGTVLRIDADSEALALQTAAAHRPPEAAPSFRDRVVNPEQERLGRSFAGEASPSPFEAAQAQNTPMSGPERVASGVLTGGLIGTLVGGPVGGVLGAAGGAAGEGAALGAEEAGFGPAAQAGAGIAADVLTGGGLRGAGRIGQQLFNKVPEARVAREAADEIRRRIPEDALVDVRQAARDLPDVAPFVAAGEDAPGLVGMVRSAERQNVDIATRVNATVRRARQALEADIDSLVPNADIARLSDTLLVNAEEAARDTQRAYDKLPDLKRHQVAPKTILDTLDAIEGEARTATGQAALPKRILATIREDVSGTLDLEQLDQMRSVLLAELRESKVLQAPARRALNRVRESIDTATDELFDGFVQRVGVGPEAVPLLKNARSLRKLEADVFESKAVQELMGADNPRQRLGSLFSGRGGGRESAETVMRALREEPAARDALQRSYLQFLWGEGFEKIGTDSSRNLLRNTRAAGAAVLGQENMQRLGSLEKRARAIRGTRAGTLGAVESVGSGISDPASFVPQTSREALGKVLNWVYSKTLEPVQREHLILDALTDQRKFDALLGGGRATDANALRAARTIGQAFKQDDAGGAAARSFLRSTREASGEGEER